MIQTQNEKRSLSELGKRRNSLFEQKHSLDKKIEKMLSDIALLVIERDKITSEMLKVDYETNKILGI